MEFKINLEDTSQTEYAEAEAWQTAVENMAGVVSLPWKYKATDVHQCAQAKVEAMRAFLGYMVADELPDYLGAWLQKEAKPKTQAVGAGSDIESVPGELPPGGFVARPGETVHIGDLAPGEIKEIALQGIDEAGEPVTEGYIGEDGCFKGAEPPDEVPALSVIDAEVPAGTTEEIDAPGTVVEGEPEGNPKEGGLREVPETE